MSGAVTAVAAVGAIAGAVSAHKSAKAQDKAQKQAARAAADQAKRAEEQAKAAEQDFNRRNQKKPNLTAIMEQNAKAGQAGSTMLTGPTGIDAGSLTLGKNTLLGG